MTDKEMTWSDRWAVRLADVVTRRPWAVLVLALAAVAATASGARFLEFSNNYRVFFGAQNPELIAFEQFQDTYTKNDNILFVVKPSGSDVFTREIAGVVESITEQAWKIPYAIRVDSVSNFQHSSADGDELVVDDLIRGGDSLSDAELAERRDVALAEPLLRGSLLAAHASATGVNVTLQYPERSLTEVPEAVAAARSIEAGIEAAHPDVDVVLSGLSMLNNAFAEAGQADAATLMPLMFVVLVLIMAVVLRSVAATASTLGIVAGSAATALGIAGFAGIKLTPISVTAPVIIMTLAIADSIHILVTMFDQMREGRGKTDALRESLRINALAVSITSVTTIVGFLALNFSDAPPFQHLGNITAVGIGAALVYSLTVLPALITVLPLRAPARRAGSRPDGSYLGRFADWVTSRHRSVLAATVAGSVLLIACTPLVDLNDEFVKYFDHRVPFRNDAEFAIDNLTGVYVVEYSLPAGEPGGISEPVYLENLERFTQWLREQPEVMHVFSYSDIVKRLNKNMHSDDPAYYRIPDERELAAQYLLLYELSLPYGLDLNDRIDIDKSSTRVSATVDDLSTVEIRSLISRSERWLAESTPKFMHTAPTGASVMFSRISERNIESMLRGNAVAIVLIAGIMMLALRSISIGALSIIPNAVPILITFGFWALTVGQVGMAAATVSATSLGIVVDDTVHFLAKYLRARREKGLDRPQAVRYAFETVGKAIISTTIILAAGFLVLAASTFRINSQMGLLTAIAIVAALVIDFLLLPALLMVGHPATARQRGVTMKTLTTNLGRATAGALIGGAALFGAWIPARAETPEDRGFAIAARSDRSDRGFGDSEVDLQMVLRNSAGKETTRELSIRTLEVPDEQLGDLSLIVFDRPADIDGTALLSHARILEPDDQWLYLPALRRVKRISSVNKSGPFVGSEFAFEDFTALELGKYDYRWLREEPCGDLSCDVVERYPRYEHSGYTRQVSWVDQRDHQVRKVEFFDRRGDLLKTLELSDYREYEDSYWRAHRLSMVNHQTGKSTDLIYSEFRFGLGLDGNDFVKGALSRIR